MQLVLDHRPSRTLDTARATVCIPAHNEAATIGDLVADIRRHLVDSAEIDEVLVVDDRSTDGTRRLAELAGARVVSSHEVLADFGPSLGKGDALWRGMSRLRGDVAIWCDADVSGFDVARLGDLAAAVHDNPDVHLVKGCFRRRNGETGAIARGRVTELAARPTLQLLFPELAGIEEPLGGLVAVRTASFARLWVEPDYGVDLGLLIDVSQRWGRGAIKEVDLGELRHRSRPLHELAGSALAVHRVALDRIGIEANVARLKRPPLAWLATDDLDWVTAHPTRRGSSLLVSNR